MSMIFFENDEKDVQDISCQGSFRSFKFSGEWGIRHIKRSFSSNLLIEDCIFRPYKEIKRFTRDYVLQVLHNYDNIY